jgi:phage terminase Nu1 subunit (DNA packaging protein)
MLQRKDIAQIIGCSVSLIQQWQQQGFLPPPDKAYGKPLLWKEETIRHFCKTKNMVKAYA